MPIISNFFGILVRMRHGDHAPPHVHVEYQGHRALVELAGGTVKAGSLPGKVAVLVRDWCAEHREELLADWALAQTYEPLLLIPGADRDGGAPMPTTPALLDILSVQTMANGRLYLRFSDETAGEFDAAWLVSKSGALLEPLRSPAYFARAFVDGGGLCWPNGLELSPATVQSWLRDHDRLTDTHRAA